MHLEEEWDYGDLEIAWRVWWDFQPLLDPRLDHWVYPRLQFAALRRVGEDLGGYAAALGGVGDELVDDVVGVKRLDAEFVQKTRKEGLAAGNPSR